MYLSAAVGYLQGAFGSSGPPIIIGEAFYNDVDEANTLAAAASGLSYPIAFLMQFPTQFPVGNDFSIFPPYEFMNYIGHGW